MKPYLTYTLLALCLALPAGAAAQAPVLPEPVARYYGDHNAAAAYSTPAERVRLSTYASADAVRQGTRSARLEAVYRQLARVRAQTLDADPGIALPNAAGASPPVASELVQPRRLVRQEAGVLVVEVTVFALQPEHNRQLIAAYDRGERTPSLPASGFFQRHVAVHEWVLRDGRWLREGASLVLIEE